MNYDLFREHGIIQLSTQRPNEYIKLFDKFNLLKYKNKKCSTLFTDLDKNFDNHSGDKYVLFSEKNINIDDLSKDNIKSIYTITIEDNKYLNKLNINNIFIDIYQSNFDKINGINALFWINLNRSINRRKHMLKELENIKVPCYRVEAFDGDDDLTYLFDKDVDYNKKSFVPMSNHEIGATLSHLKAINMAIKNNFKYTMICEDDISFENLKYFNHDLKHIIDNAPPFDILMVSNSGNIEFKDEYTNWNDKYKNKIFISGAMCYIVSKSGLSKFKNIFTFDGNKFKINSKKLKIAEIFVFSEVNTFTYQYNFVTFKLLGSCIHNSCNSAHKMIKKKKDEEVYKKYRLYMEYI